MACFNSGLNFLLLFRCCWFPLFFCLQTVIPCSSPTYLVIGVVVFNIIKQVKNYFSVLKRRHLYHSLGFIVCAKNPGSGKSLCTTNKDGNPGCSVVDDMLTRVVVCIIIEESMWRMRLMSARGVSLCCVMVFSSWVTDFLYDDQG